MKRICWMLALVLSLLMLTPATAEEALPPEGYLRVDAIVMAGVSTFSHLAMTTHEGKTLNWDLDWEDWYEGAAFVEASAPGATTSMGLDGNGITDITISHMVFTFDFDGETRELVVAPGKVIPYEGEGEAMHFVWEAAAAE